MIEAMPIAEDVPTLLDRAGRHAPYLRRLIARDGGALALGEMADVPAQVEAELAGLRALAAEPPDISALSDALRIAKRRAHLCIALADLAGLWPLDQVTAAITDLADLSLQAALSGALAARGLSGDGLFLVALGKMGAHELNYSSDVDVAAYFDPDVFSGGHRAPGDAAVRVIRDVCQLMEAQTGEGYVFRTDLRLRPDPRSTPVAVSTRRAETYYESVGQNWERMVWIKARPCAGDFDTANAFMQVMRPFVWRRHLDYWAIADIHAIKRMINASAGDPALDDVASDVKLGPGGIREIEFFAQTQQLILGGREPSLRPRGTLEALGALVAAGSVSEETADTLGRAYTLLRAVEHRVQMRNDEQTHALPADADARADVSTLMGASDLATFDKAVRATRRQVHGIYLDLFADEDRQSAAAASGNLVFTGVDNDPGTIATLQGMGFQSPGTVIETVRDWHFSRVPATATRRGQELLTVLTPNLLAAMGKTGEPDTAFRHFERFFRGLRSGVQLMSMLLAEPDILDDLVSTLALAPRLAQILAARPNLLEALIMGEEAEPFVPLEEAGFEAAMDEARRYHRDETFLIGHRLLHGRQKARDAASAWTGLADTMIRAMAKAAEIETTRRFGPVPGLWSVCAMGKLGAGEQSAGSDLDLLLIYDPDEAEISAAQSWFTRFTQRLITALSAPTAEGELYEVDMRLRPSGRAGPVAVRLSAFEHYQFEEAWTWEHMALTRIRPVAGDAALGRTVVDTACRAIDARHTSPDLVINIADMRARLRRERAAQGPWDVKLAPGGLVDIEFVAQFGLLSSGGVAAILPSTQDALVHLKSSGWLAPDAGDDLIAAHAFQSALQQVLRLAVGDSVLEDDLPDGLRERLCRAVDADGFEALVERLKAHQKRASDIHLHFLPPPATES